MRIIAGEWRGRRLALPRGTSVRPTPDRVRETVFNWLGDAIVGRDCLDLYAGSGAFGFEALSRGARSVVFVESDRRLAGALESHATLLAAHEAVVVRADAAAFAGALSRRGPVTGPSRDADVPSHPLRAPRRYGMIFLDPPYSEALEPLLDATLGLLASDGLIYVERPAVEGLPRHDALRWHRQGRAGRIVFGLAAA